MKSYYTILGVSSTASQNEIRKAYRKLAVKYHPDKHYGDCQYESLLKEINVAYETLSDPEKRKYYDFTIPNFSEYKHTQYKNGSQQYTRNSEPSFSETNITSIALSIFERIKGALFFILVLVIIKWLLSFLNSNQSSNDSSRPKSGEINFQK